MPNAKTFRGGFLEFADKSGIGELPASQNLLHIAKEVIVRKSFRRNDRQAFFEHRMPSHCRRKIRTLRVHCLTPNYSGRFACLPISVAGLPATTTPSGTSF